MISCFNEVHGSPINYPNIVCHFLIVYGRFTSRVEKDTPFILSQFSSASLSFQDSDSTDPKAPLGLGTTLGTTNEQTHYKSIKLLTFVGFQMLINVCVKYIYNI